MSSQTPAWQRILILVAAILGVLVTSSLGFWQLGRADEKLGLQSAKDQQAALPALEGRVLELTKNTSTHGKELVYRKVLLQGQWLAEHTVYLENRQMQGRPGFYVVTPFKIAETGTVVLVQRGWAPRSFMDRAALPSIETPTTAVKVQGHLAPWPSRLYDFGAAEAGPLRQNLDLQLFRQQTGLPLLEISVLQQGAASEGLLRDWPVVATGVEKHYGYAFQWFGLSALIALLYVWFQIVQPRRKKSAG